MARQFSPIKKPAFKPISKSLSKKQKRFLGEFRAQLNTGFRKQMQNAVWFRSMLFSKASFVSLAWAG